MALQQKAIEEFKEIFKKEYGKELADSEARESAENLVGFFRILYDHPWCSDDELSTRDGFIAMPPDCSNGLG